MSKHDDELIAKFDKTDNADILRALAEDWGGIVKADDEFFYFGNGRKKPNRDLSLGERWALETQRGPSFTIENRQQ